MDVDHPRVIHVAKGAQKEDVLKQPLNKKGPPQPEANISKKSTQFEAVSQNSVDEVSFLRSLLLILNP